MKIPIPKSRAAQIIVLNMDNYPCHPLQSLLLFSKRLIHAVLTPLCSVAWPLTPQGLRDGASFPPVHFPACRDCTPSLELCLNSSNPWFSSFPSPSDSTFIFTHNPTLPFYCSIHGSIGSSKSPCPSRLIRSYFWDCPLILSCQGLLRQLHPFFQTPPNLTTLMKQSQTRTPSSVLGILPAISLCTQTCTKFATALSLCLL